ncbi:hypothetical protein ACVWWO_003625 [Bradyrhizobium sp. F1.13.1]
MSAKDVPMIAGGRSHLAHLAIVGVGAAPNIELEQTAGLAVDEGIVPGRCSRLRFRTFWRWLTADRLYKKRIRLEASRNAQRQKAAAATNMLGENRPYEDIPWFWVRSIRPDTANPRTLSGTRSARHQRPRREAPDLVLPSRRRTPRGRVRIREPGSVARGVRFAEIMIIGSLAPGQRLSQTPR